MSSANRNASFVRGLEITRIADAAQGRRHRRVSMLLPIRAVLNGERERKAVLTDLSVRGCGIVCDAEPLLGDTAELRVPDLGVLRGRVARIGGGSIGIALAGSKADRQARADALMVFLNGHDGDSRAIRYPYAEETVLELMNGRVAHCTVRDLSTTGAAVETALIPAIGEKVRIGQRRGTVTRHHKNGIGVTFVTSL